MFKSFEYKKIPGVDSFEYKLGDKKKNTPKRYSVNEIHDNKRKHNKVNRRR